MSKRKDQDPVEQVLRLREAGKVERCHTLPIAGRNGYPVSSHVYDMLVLLEVLHPPFPDARLFRAILLHDAHERVIGDIPGAIKEALPDSVAALDRIKHELDRRLGYVVFLTPEEKLWLKALDRIEFFLWCRDQIAQGNKHIEGRLRAITAELKGMSMPPPCKEFLRNYRWRRTNDRIP